MLPSLVGGAKTARKDWGMSQSAPHKQGLRIALLVRFGQRGEASRRRTHCAACADSAALKAQLVHMPHQRTAGNGTRGGEGGAWRKPRRLRQSARSSRRRARATYAPEGTGEGARPPAKQPRRRGQSCSCASARRSRARCGCCWLAGARPAAEDYLANSTSPDEEDERTWANLGRRRRRRRRRLAERGELGTLD